MDSILFHLYPKKMMERKFTSFEEYETVLSTLKMYKERVEEIIKLGNTAIKSGLRIWPKEVLYSMKSLTVKKTLQELQDLSVKSLLISVSIVTF